MDKSQPDADIAAQVAKLAAEAKEKAAASGVTPPDLATPDARQAFLSQQLQMLNLAKNQGVEMPKTMWAFWDTQPVPKMKETISDEDLGAIEASRDNVRQEPYSLPKNFEWDDVDIRDPAQLTELYELLNENYVEDDDNMFRFDYSPEFLKWALSPPGWHTDWLCAVRASTTKKMVGFISAIPATIRTKTMATEMVEINFLCVHKKLRSKRLAPTLIREITRRVNKRNIFQACYTAGVVIPKPVSTARYHHRSLNPKKLVEIQFSALGRNQTMNRLIRLMKVPNQTSLPGLRKMEKKDCEKARALLGGYLQKFDMTPIYSEEEFEHWFLPREGVISSYVVENSDGELTDFGSFYSLPSTVVNNKNHSTLNAAYCFYNVSDRLKDLMQDMLVIATNQKFDVFNALDLMENEQFLKPLKFGEGDGNLNYYLYNWRCPELDKKKLGLVLL